MKGKNRRAQAHQLKMLSHTCGFNKTCRKLILQTPLVCADMLGCASPPTAKEHNIRNIKKTLESSSNQRHQENGINIIVY